MLLFQLLASICFPRIESLVKKHKISRFSRIKLESKFSIAFPLFFIPLLFTITIFLPLSVFLDLLFILYCRLKKLEIQFNRALKIASISKYGLWGNVGNLRGIYTACFHGTHFSIEGNNCWVCAYTAKYGWEKSSALTYFKSCY